MRSKIALISCIFVSVSLTVQASYGFTFESATAVYTNESLKNSDPNFLNSEHFSRPGINPKFLDIVNLQKQTHEAKMSVERYFGYMKFYLNDTTYDFFGFEEGIEDLRKELSDIGTSVANVSASKDLLDSLKFIIDFFNYIEFCIDKLTHFIDVPGSRIFKRIMDVNVGALAMHNLDGSLNLRHHGYLDKILNFQHSVSFLEKEFKSQRGTPLDMRLIFDDQVTKARQVLDNLKTYILIPNYYCLSRQGSPSCIDL
ncbi:hypothetical protein JCM33374_g759 [Metschnikowia sp. JCM 33374]|nr:hypothetical protein JCM33374_g759 [Metschnikowia sp. JCM 33374]